MLDLFGMDHQINPGNIVVDSLNDGIVPEYKKSPKSTIKIIDIEESIVANGSGTAVPRRKASPLSTGRREAQEALKSLLGVFEHEAIERNLRFVAAEAAKVNRESQRMEREAANREHVDHL